MLPTYYYIVTSFTRSLEMPVSKPKTFGASALFLLKRGNYGPRDTIIRRHSRRFSKRNLPKEIARSPLVQVFNVRCSRRYMTPLLARRRPCFFFSAIWKGNENRAIVLIGINNARRNIVRHISCFILKILLLLYISLIRSLCFYSICADFVCIVSLLNEGDNLRYRIGID